MSVALLDTSVASLLHPKKKKKSARLLARYEPHLQGNRLAISFQSVAELWDWAEANGWGSKARVGLGQFIHRFLVIPYDVELAKVWARVMQSARAEGRRLESGDCWVLAMAVDRALPLLTHDRDMVGRNVPGLQVISDVDVED